MTAIRISTLLMTALAVTACGGPREANIVTPGASCDEVCGANQFCDRQTEACVCATGYVEKNGACVKKTGAVIPLPDPDERTKSAVCARWSEGHRITAPQPFTRGANECDPGTLDPDAIADTVRRIDMFRWFAGLDPVTSDAAFDAEAQACSALAAFWDFNRPESPHMPTASAKCYSAAAARGAGASNMSWGTRHPANAVDAFMEDAGENNVDALGHRRWILNPPLGPVGVGYYEGGTAFGAASCLRVFGMRGGAANPAWNAIPPAGYAPIEMARWTWSFQGSLPGITQANVKVVRDRDDMELPVTIRRLQVGAGQNAVSWVPNGWAPEAEVTYKVTISGLGGADVTYETTPIVCN